MKPAIILILIGGGLLMVGSCASSKKGDSPSGLYKSAEGRAICHESYDRAMELWSVAYQEEWVETAYGRTHIVISGPQGGKPIFLMAGLFADASMWYANAGALAEEHRVFAVDLPVYGGKSEVSERRITDIDDYTAWFSTILTHYHYEKAALAGLSYGSWLSLALAREMPERVSALMLLDPSETFAKMRKIMLWKGFKYFMLFPNRNKYTKFFDWMGGGYSDPKLDIWFEHMLDVIEYGSVGMMDVPQHRVYGPEELGMITMPVLVLAGGKPIIYKDPEAFAKATAAALPHAEIEIVPDTGHSLNMEKAEVVNRWMLRFLETKRL
jgi:pimeloyl-ACP methyl ester carboxylesterase